MPFCGFEVFHFAKGGKKEQSVMVNSHVEVGLEFFINITITNIFCAVECIVTPARFDLSALLLYTRVDLIGSSCSVSIDRNDLPFTL